MNSGVDLDAQSVDLIFMNEALIEARKALDKGEVPVGAVLVIDGKVIGRGYNQVILRSDPSMHAEMVALRHAASLIKNYRLPASTLYVTLEPCMMCLGLILHARVKRLVVGTMDTKVGALRWLDQDGRLPGGNHRLLVTTLVEQQQCQTLLKGFFEGRRLHAKGATGAVIGHEQKDVTSC